MLGVKGCTFPYLVQPPVALTCTTSLRAIAMMLNDSEHPISGETLDAVRGFVSDGVSPLFGSDESRASVAALNLRELVASGRHIQIPGFVGAFDQRSRLFR